MAKVRTKSSSPSNKNNGAGKVTWAEMARDVLITAINRGQLPILGILFIVCIVVWRLPVASLSEIASDIFLALKAGEMWAYGLFAITASGWFVHSNSMRRIFSNEMRRVGKEKSKLQNKMVNGSFKSSE